MYLYHKLICCLFEIQNYHPVFYLRSPRRIPISRQTQNSRTNHCWILSMYENWALVFTLIKVFTLVKMAESFQIRVLFVLPQKEEGIKKGKDNERGRKKKRRKKEKKKE